MGNLIQDLKYGLSQPGPVSKNGRLNTYLGYIPNITRKWDVWDFGCILAAIQ